MPTNSNDVGTTPRRPLNTRRKLAIWEREKGLLTFYRLNVKCGYEKNLHN